MKLKDKNIREYRFPKETVFINSSIFYNGENTNFIKDYYYFL